MKIVYQSSQKLGLWIYLQVVAVCMRVGDHLCRQIDFLSLSIPMCFYLKFWLFSNPNNGSLFYFVQVLFFVNEKQKAAHQDI